MNVSLTLPSTEVMLFVPPRVLFIIQFIVTCEMLHYWDAGGAYSNDVLVFYLASWRVSGTEQEYLLKIER